MTESLDERLKRRTKELEDKIREWPFSSPQAVHTHLASIEKSLASGFNHTLVANIEAVNRLRGETPQPYCGFAELAGMEVIQSDLVPKDTAYMISAPKPFEWPLPNVLWPDEDYKPYRFSTMVKLGVPRHVIHDCWEVDAEPKVKWPEPVVPAQPLSWWQWLVIVGVLSWILCALSRAV